MLKECYLALGSNLNHPKRQIERAYDELSIHSKLINCALSSLFVSRAMTKDDEEQADYINAVVRLQTELQPKELLHLTRSIEKKMGRVSSRKLWQSRIIDIDILLMENIVSSDSELTLPHPGLLSRSFVLYPLAEIASHLILPNGMAVKDLAAAIKSKDLWQTHRLELETTRQDRSADWLQAEL